MTEKVLVTGGSSYNKSNSQSDNKTNGNNIVGSGFLASWCIKILLSRGYIVHTTVRSAEKVKHLLI